MEVQQRCSACGAILVGAFQPQITLTETASGEGAEQEPLEVRARARVCVGCGLVHWYVAGEALEQLQGVSGYDEQEPPRPGASYERRTQVLRMLRRVRRM